MLDHSSSLTWIIPFSVLSASFVGSLHCVAMCGPLIVNFARDRKAMALYQFGRLLSYGLMGAAAGALGAQVFDMTKAVWVPVLSMGLIGTLLFINGFRAIQGKQFHLQLPKWLETPFKNFWRVIYSAKIPRALLPVSAGFLTVFLPCGHLYSFIAGAIATGSAAKGGLFMATFWLGTVPALAIGIGKIKSIIQGRFGQSQRGFGYLLMLGGLVGLLNFTSGVYALAKNQPQAGHNHEAAAPPLTCGSLEHSNLKDHDMTHDTNHEIHNEMVPEMDHSEMHHHQ